MNNSGNSYPLPLVPTKQQESSSTSTSASDLLKLLPKNHAQIKQDADNARAILLSIQFLLPRR